MRDDLAQYSREDLLQVIRELEETNAHLRDQVALLSNTTQADTELARPVGPPLFDDPLRRTSLLTQLAIEFRETTDQQTIVEQALRVLAQHAFADYATILLIAPDGTPSVAVGIRSGEVEALDEDHVSSVLEHGLAGWVVRNESSVALSDISRDRRWLQFSEQNLDGSVIALPIRQTRATLGVLTIHRFRANAFTSHDLLLTEGVTAQIGLALNTARLVSNEFRSREQALALFSVSQFLTAERSFEDLADLIQRKCVRIFGGLYGVLYIAEEDLPPAAIRLPSELLNADPRLLQDAEHTAAQAWERQSVIKRPINDLPEPLVCVGFPMVHGGSAIGVFVLIYPELEEATLSSSVWSMLTIFTQVIAGACSNIQMIARFKHQNRTLETQVQRRTQQLSYSRDVLRVLVDSLPYGVVLLDPAEHIQAANLVFCRQAIGMHPRDVVYRPYDEVLQDMTQRLVMRVERTDTDGSGGITRLIVLTEPDGQSRRYSVKRFPILNVYREVEQLVEFWRDAEA